MDYTLKSLNLINIRKDKENKSNYKSNYNIKFILYEKKIIVYNNDGSFNRVRISENIFVDIFNKQLLNETKNKLSKKIGESYTLIESGQKINIDKDFTEEYIYSKSAISLTTNRKIIKFKIIENLKEIIENSHSRLYSNDKKEKHKIDAKYGFYKYKINFSIIINKKEELYEGIVLIRNDANKKKYLYDILGIKKID